jgi:DNA-binding response OmpR family regulator
VAAVSAIIDDNVDAADGLAALVRVRGGEAEVAYDGDSGVRVASCFQPDVILLDIATHRSRAPCALRERELGRRHRAAFGA